MNNKSSFTDYINEATFHTDEKALTKKISKIVALIDTLPEMDREIEKKGEEYTSLLMKFLR
jgi:uncharacterized protein YacL (UPF0231 family)